MTKKILVISPLPTHPQTGGNKMRIFNILSFYQRQGCEITFVHRDLSGVSSLYRGADLAAMYEEWDLFYYISPRPFPFLDAALRHPKTRFGRKLISWLEVGKKIRDFYLITASNNLGQLGRILRLNWPGIYRALKPFFPDLVAAEKGRVSILHRLCYDKLNNLLQKLAVADNYDLVIAEYYRQAPFLRHFGPKIVKVVDTHDSFACRAGGSEEQVALQHADIVLSIQDEEKKYFEQLLDRPRVMTIGHLDLDWPHPTLSSDNHDLLYLGSDNLDNKKALTFFLRSIFPLIRRVLPDCRLVIGGTICRLLPKDDGVVKQGEIKNLKNFYDQSSVVINPVIGGTGLKTKNLEALVWGKVLITTSAGIRGIAGMKDCVLLGDTPEEFARQVIRVLTDKRPRREMSEKAIKFSGEYQHEVRERLLSLLAMTNRE